MDIFGTREQRYRSIEPEDLLGVEIAPRIPQIKAKVLKNTPDVVKTKMV